MSENKLLEMAIKDLVTLATKANNVIIQGSFSGAISDEVQDVLEMCNHVRTALTEEEGKDEEQV